MTWASRWLDRRFAAKLAREATLVARPERTRCLWVLDTATAVVVFTAMIGYPWMPEPWRIGLFWILCLFVGCHLFSRIGRAMTYRRGWLEGRGTMAYAFVEAYRRGMEPGEWLQAEMTRDYFVVFGEPPETGPVDGEQRE